MLLVDVQALTERREWLFVDTNSCSIPFLENHKTFNGLKNTLLTNHTIDGVQFKNKIHHFQMIFICHASRCLVSFVQFKKMWKTPMDECYFI